MRSLRDAFWVFALGVIGTYAFFYALGAYGMDDVLPVTLLVAALTVLWVAHALLDRRGTEEHHDPRMTRARERRGF
jgi:uncharacterized membrane protein YhaH (DUF805 family)